MSGKNTQLVWEPRKATGEVPKGRTRVSVKKGCWSSEGRMYQGEVIDILEADFAGLSKFVTKA